MKFGDIVINEWAGDQNPQKILMVVHHGKTVKCLSLTGKEVLFSNDKDLRLTKISSIDFSGWKEIVSNQPLDSDTKSSGD
jgi:hypothetical protein